MAEGIRRSRVNVVDKFLRPIGSTWLHAFFRRHPHLKTKLSKAIEMARIKDVTKEQSPQFQSRFPPFDPGEEHQT